MPVAINSMKFWINAFIPRQVPGYTQDVTKGPHVGKTMIPGPFPHSDCYLTDQRSFDAYIHAKSRMHSEFKVDFTGLQPTLSQFHNCDRTTELDCIEGGCECNEKGRKDRMKFVLVKPIKGRQVVVRMKCAANNPCAPTSRAFGDIDYTGTITLDIAQRSITFDGLIDDFPAFEAYATINDQEGIPVFRINPPRGNTVRDLPREAKRPIKAVIKDADGDGVFGEGVFEELKPQ